MEIDLAGYCGRRPPVSKWTPWLFLVLSAEVCLGQDPMRLTLAEAERLAVQNNPALSSAGFTASAVAQIANEIHSNLEPTVSGLVTGVGADSGSRLAAGGLNNPVVY